MKQSLNQIPNIQTYLATLDNKLISAKYSLTLTEIRIILLIISKINNDPENPERLCSDRLYTLNISEFAEVFNLTYDHALDQVWDAMEIIYKRDLFYYDNENILIRTRWISSFVKYDKRSGYVNFKFADDIIPLISELKSNFTSYRIRYLSKLQSSHSIRLYELLLMELSKGRKAKITLSLDIAKVKYIMDLENKYKNFNDFFGKVLQRCFKEINETSDIHVEVLKSIKEGKRIKALQIEVSWK